MLSPIKQTFVIVSLFLFQGCKTHVDSVLNIPPPCPTEKITRTGELNVCCFHNSTDYYVLKGVPQGFHYELAKDFANSNNLKLRIHVCDDLDSAFIKLNNGEYDILAMNLTVSNERSNKVKFIDPLFYAQPVLVKHKNDTLSINFLADLGNQEIIVQKGTIYKEIIERMIDTAQIAPLITEIDSMSYEDIIVKIAEGEIKYSIIDLNIAEFVNTYAKNLNYSHELTGPIPVTWAIPKTSLLLDEEINSWLTEIKKGDRFAVLYNKYYRDSYVNLQNSRYNKIKKGIISEFDDVIKKEANVIDWDWRLLAALIFQESGFDPEITSERGAAGLMQVMPETAVEFGFDEYIDYKTNIKVGVRYLMHLQKIFSKFDIEQEELIKFTLASYNSGPGHVLDAMKLAEVYDKNPYIWDDNVDYFLLNKYQPEYYKNPVVQHGYCNGKQAYAFVYNILENYAHYKNTIPE